MSVCHFIYSAYGRAWADDILQLPGTGSAANCRRYVESVSCRAGSDRQHRCNLKAAVDRPWETKRAHDEGCRAAYPVNGTSPPWKPASSDEAIRLHWVMSIV